MEPQGKRESLAPPLGRRELQGAADIGPQTPKEGRCSPPPDEESSLGTISTVPPRWLVSRRPGHRVQLLAIERVGMEAWLPDSRPSFLFLGKEGATPSALGACPRASMGGR